MSAVELLCFLYIWKISHGTQRCQRGKKSRYKRCLMGNVRSLANKMDELTVRGNICRVMCFTETWLYRGIPDFNATLTGCVTVQPDRN